MHQSFTVNPAQSGAFVPLHRPLRTVTRGGQKPVEFALMVPPDSMPGAFVDGMNVFQQSFVACAPIRSWFNL